MILIVGGGRLGNRVYVLVDGLIIGLVVFFCWPLIFDANLDFFPLMSI